MPPRTANNRRTSRLPRFDYRTHTAYFVTVCTRDRELFFADETLARIVEDTWRSLFWRPAAHEHDFVVMPNHVHGIIWFPASGANLATGSLGAAVRTFKALSTRRVNRVRRSYGASLWQRNYDARIVRDDRDLALIREYIRDNPAKWDADPDNPARLA